MQALTTLVADEAVVLVTDVLARLGTPVETARSVAGWLVNADISGHGSHGISKVVDYARRIGSGEIDPVGRATFLKGEDEGPAVLIDGGGGFGHPAAHLLTATMVDRVKTLPVVVGGIVNASHTGRLGEWAEQAAGHGAIMMMFTASVDRASVAAYGAREPRLGTNPFAAGVPGRDEDAMILDFATSRIAGGRVHAERKAGGKVPEGSLLDADGNPTTDPRALDAGGMLLAFGEHKGYGLSLLVSLLAGCVVGAAGNDNVRPGVLAIAVAPGVFADHDVVRAAAQAQLDRMRATPHRAGFERVEVPGDYERRSRDDFDGNISVPTAVWQEICSLAQGLGVSISLNEPGTA